MSTGAALITHVAQVSGMDATAASADRALILTWIQRAVDNCSLDAEIVNDPTQSVTLTQGQSLYDLTASPFAIVGIIAINDVTITDSSSSNLTMEHITMGEMLDRQQGSGQGQGTPYAYAVEYPVFMVHPAPSSAATLNVSFVAEGPTIADDATVLTLMPRALQFGVLGNFAIAQALKYKKQKNWTDYETTYLRDTVCGMPALRRWRSRSGGKRRPSRPTYRRVVTSPSQDTGSWLS